ncbi:hypothetical protein E5358_12520 [Palleniella muris]|uniref:Uncharacterized protein n=1 Tax=Palleniella muris TaxID=3038145 RepID=A0AC61QMP8_9BACT|nr:hypothetical protein [Palleniella muris]TGX80589.1 hypothetical protein E5358_12520 [Palleniella muris]
MEMKLSMFYVSLVLGRTGKVAEIEEIGKLMLEYFKDKSYSEDVEIYEIDLTCIGDEWDKKMVARPKYYRDKTITPPKGMEYFDSIRIVRKYICGIALDKSFAYTSKEEGYNIIAHTVMDFLEQLKYPIAIRKSFDKERFNNDMREFFRSIGCDV